MKKQNKYLIPSLLIFFSLIFLVSAGFIIDYMLDSSTQKDQYDALANMVEQVQQQVQQQQPPLSTDETEPGYTLPPFIGNVSAYTEIKHPDTGETIRMLKEYAPIFQLNTDMVGWIKIPNTKLNYPVVQTPDEPNYYLKRDFYKKSSRHGTLYANELANITVPSDNITIYGHNMADGSMLAVLHKYTSKDFYEANPYITFDTLYEHHTYQIMAVFETTDIVGDGFAYHMFVDGNIVSFPDFVAQCKKLSMYETGVNAVYGDKLLTLSTCDNNVADSHGRFVVVAKRIS